MKLKEIKVYNSKLLRQLTWANRIDRVCNGVLMRFYVPFGDRVDMNQKICIDAIKTVEPMIEGEKRSLQMARQDLSDSRYSEIKMMILRHALHDLRQAQYERHQYLSQELERAKQYRKGL